MDHHAVGLYLSDTNYLTPSAQDPTFFPELEKILIKEKIDYVFPLHSTEIAFFSKYRNLLERNSVGISVPGFDTVQLCTNKIHFIDFLKKHGFNYPTTYKKVEDIVDFPVFIKPERGSSSSGTFRIDTHSELDFYIKKSTSKYILQDYCDWEELTVDCLVNNSKVLVACVPRYRIKVKDGKAVVSKTIFSQVILDLCTELLKRIAYVGVCNIQIFYKNEEIKIIELNPRPSAGGLPLTVKAGVNIPELMIDDCFGNLGNELIPYKSDLTMYRYLTEVFR